MNESNEQSEPSSPSNETQWLAFRYVLGEMTPEEIEAFEHSLQDDPNRCESVAIAVQSVRAIADSESSDQPMIANTEAESIRVRWGFVGASLLACLIVVSLWLIPQPKRIAELQPKLKTPATPAETELTKADEQAPSIQVDDAVAGQLVSLWTRSSMEIDRPANDSGDEWTELATSPDEVIESDNEFGWMLAAVSDKTSASPDPAHRSVEN